MLKMAVNCDALHTESTEVIDLFILSISFINNTSCSRAKNKSQCSY